MTAGHGPENWIGAAVAVHAVGRDDTLVGNLVEVDDRGITLRVPRVYDEDSETWVETEPVLTFHPWSSMVMLQVEEGDVERGDAG